MGSQMQEGAMTSLPFYRGTFLLDERTYSTFRTMSKDSKDLRRTHPGNS